MTTWRCCRQGRASLQGREGGGLHLIPSHPPASREAPRAIPPLPPFNAGATFAHLQDRDRGMVVEGATTAPVASEAECVALMRAGMAARAVSATGQPPAGPRCSAPPPLLTATGDPGHWKLPAGTLV